MTKDHRSAVIAFWVMTVTLIGFMAATIYSAGHRAQHWTGPSGKVTQKMWVQEFWQAGEQLYPARWCLELNYRDEVCIPESDWNKISIGDWYGEK